MLKAGKKYPAIANSFKFKPKDETVEKWSLVIKKEVF